ncbi:MAG: glutamate--cysteine ligase [Myxococcota bacterium]
MIQRMHASSKTTIAPNNRCRRCRVCPYCGLSGGMSINTAKRLTRDSLLAEYHSYGHPSEEWLVGGEYERHLLRPDGTPVPYFGDYGVAWLLEKLTHRGWKPTREGNNIIALTRNSASVTLEPGGQFELAGAPYASVHGVVAETLAFVEELGEVIGDAPIHPIALGYTPFAQMDDIDWVPKGRYKIMRDHLGKTGALAHDMMKGTCAVQASFDFSDEADCARKMALSMKLGPLTTALFANSPIRYGKPSGYMSFRGHVWTQTDPARTGFPDAANNFTFARWLDYLLDVPMMFTKIDGEWADANGRSFRDWMDNGIDGVYPKNPDWELHLTSVFPEARVKRQIEVRGADCVNLALSASFVALFKGLFYCRKATDAALEVAEQLAACGTREERFATACKYGLEGTVGDKTLAEWAKLLVEVSYGGISRCAPEDLPLLQPLIAQINSGRSPAADLLDAFLKDPTPETVLREAAYRPQSV